MMRYAVYEPDWKTAARKKISRIVSRMETAENYLRQAPIAAPEIWRVNGDGQPVERVACRHLGEVVSPDHPAISRREL